MQDFADELRALVEEFCEAESMQGRVVALSIFHANVSIVPAPEHDPDPGPEPEAEAEPAGGGAGEIGPALPPSFAAQESSVDAAGAAIGPSMPPDMSPAVGPTTPLMSPPIGPALPGGAPSGRLSPVHPASPEPIGPSLPQSARAADEIGPALPPAALPASASGDIGPALLAPASRSLQGPSLPSSRVPASKRHRAAAPADTVTSGPVRFALPAFDCSVQLMQPGPREAALSLHVKPAAGQRIAPETATKSFACFVTWLRAAARSRAAASS
jgi:hypothetical protein